MPPSTLFYSEKENAPIVIGWGISIGIWREFDATTNGKVPKGRAGAGAGR